MQGIRKLHFLATWSEREVLSRSQSRERICASAVKKNAKGLDVQTQCQAVEEWQHVSSFERKDEGGLHRNE